MKDSAYVVRGGNCLGAAGSGFFWARFAGRFCAPGGVLPVFSRRLDQPVRRVFSGYETPAQRYEATFTHAPAVFAQTLRRIDLTAADLSGTRFASRNSEAQMVREEEAGPARSVTERAEPYAATVSRASLPVTVPATANLVPRDTFLKLETCNR